jgi:hypothetical protein
MFGWGKLTHFHPRPSSTASKVGPPFPQLLTLSSTDDAQQNAQEVYGADGGYDNPEHKGKFSHELVAGAASFEGFKLYEDHQRKEGTLSLSSSS